MEKVKPTIGRIVHFTSREGAKHEAAMIVDVFNDECVNLVVYGHSGSTRTETSVLRGAGANRWDWPARV